MVRSWIAIFLLCFLFFILIDFIITKYILFYLVKKRKREILVSKTPVVSLMPKPLDLPAPAPPPILRSSSSLSVHTKSSVLYLPTTDPQCVAARPLQPSSPALTTSPPTSSPSDFISDLAPFSMVFPSLMSALPTSPSATNFKWCVFGVLQGFELRVCCTWQEASQELCTLGEEIEEEEEWCLVIGLSLKSCIFYYSSLGICYFGLSFRFSSVWLWE